MTKKRVSLLFMLMLCNVVSVRAESGFGFFSGLFGLLKSMQTIFYFNNPVNDNIAENFIGMRVNTPRTLSERIFWRWGWQTRRHTKKFEEARNQRVTEFFKKQNEEIIVSNKKQMDKIIVIQKGIDENEKNLMQYSKDFTQKEEEISQEIKQSKNKIEILYQDLEKKDEERKKQQEYIIEQATIKLEILDQKGKDLEESTKQIKIEGENLRGFEEELSKELNESNKKNEEDINKLKTEVIEIKNEINNILFLQQDNQTDDLQKKFLQYQEEIIKDIEIRKLLLGGILKPVLKKEGRDCIANVIFGEKTKYLPFLENPKSFLNIRKYLKNGSKTSKKSLEYAQKVSNSDKDIVVQISPSAQNKYDEL